MLVITQRMNYGLERQTNFVKRQKSLIEDVLRIVLDITL